MAPYVLHHERSGEKDGAVLLMVGSLGTTLAMWEPLLPALIRNRTVIRLDVRGHGRSPAPPGPYSIEELGRDVVVTLDELGLDSAAFCGLSIGGMIGMWLAAHAPARVERLALVCTSAHMPDASEAYRERAQNVRAHGSTERIADGAIERWFTSAWAQAHPDIADTYRRMLLTIPADGYAGCCDAVAALDLRAALPAITAPTLVIAGADDRATPPSHAEAIVRGIPGAQLEVLPDTAHLASVQRPDAVTQLVDAHLAR